MCACAGSTSTGAGSSRSMNLGSRTITRARKQVSKILAQNFFLDIAHRIARQVRDKDNAVQQIIFGKFYRECVLHRLRIKRGARGADGEAVGPDRHPVATPLHWARDHDEAVAATAQWFGGLASPDRCRRCPLVRNHCEWQRSIVGIPNVPERNNQAGVISAVPAGAFEGK
jgi:hypothetical protein